MGYGSCETATGYNDAAQIAERLRSAQGSVAIPAANDDSGPSVVPRAAVLPAAPLSAVASRSMPWLPRCALPGLALPVPYSAASCRSCRSWRCSLTLPGPAYRCNRWCLRAALVWCAKAVRTVLSTQLCRIGAEINDRNCPLSASLQLSSPPDAASRAVYKTAALRAELRRQDTLSTVADPLATVAGCTAFPRVPASRAEARPASSSPNPVSMPSSGTLRRRYRADTPLGLLGEGDRPGTPGSGSGTGAPARRSAPAARPPRRRPPCAHTRRPPAPTPGRTAGSTPSRTGTTRRSSPRPPRLHPVHAQPRQVREQHGQQGLPLLRDIPDDATAELVFAVRPCGGLVVEGAALQASVQDADEPVGELAQGSVYRHQIAGEITSAATATDAIFGDASGFVSAIGSASFAPKLVAPSATCAGTGWPSTHVRSASPYRLVQSDVNQPDHARQASFSVRSVHADSGPLGPLCGSPRLRRSPPSDRFRWSRFSQAPGLWPWEAPAWRAPALRWCLPLIRPVRPASNRCCTVSWPLVVDCPAPGHSIQVGSRASLRDRRRRTWIWCPVAGIWESGAGQES